MHDMQTIVTDLRGVCRSVSPSLYVCLSRGLALQCWGHSVQPLPNHFGLLLSLNHSASKWVPFIVNLRSPTFSSSYTLCLKNFPLCNRLKLCQTLTNFQNFLTGGKCIKFATKPFNISHITPSMSMLLHYLGKSKVQICCKSERNCKQNESIFTCTHFTTFCLLTYY